MSAYTILVNGQSRKVEAPEDMPLLWVLRDLLDLRGTKFGCGIGLCGACTVHLDGDAVRSCSMPVSLLEGKSITTIEGLGRNGPDPLQKAWCELDVAQCGYCQAGQIMSAAAFLKKIPKPADAEIDPAMAGNLCRCGTYGRIRQAIKQAAGIPAGAASANASPASA